MPQSRMRRLMEGGVYFSFSFLNAAFIEGRSSKEEIKYIKCPPFSIRFYKRTINPCRENASTYGVPPQTLNIFNKTTISKYQFHAVTSGFFLSAIITSHAHFFPAKFAQGTVTLHCYKKLQFKIPSTNQILQKIKVARTKVNDLSFLRWLIQNGKSAK